MILDSDWLLFVNVYVLIHTNQSESSITSDQSNPSKLKPFKSYSKTIIEKLFEKSNFYMLKSSFFGGKIEFLDFFGKSSFCPYRPSS